VSTAAAGAVSSLVLGGHGIVMAIVLPLVMGSVLVVLEKFKSRWVVPLSVGATLALLVLSMLLLAQAHSGHTQAYLLGNWQAPFGISLVLDRLSALMLVLMAVVSCGALLYALGGDHQRGEHFHSLFQYQLMGLAGAFLTADLFNLFVFFEVLLAASYGLLLHGASRARLRASLHYVTFNLVGSALFLFAVSLLYALTGTLNMADMAVKLQQLGPQDVRLAQAAALMLLVVFAVKAALLPLYFWLPDTYAAASGPVAALFAIMTKVGVYAIARTTALIFGAGAGVEAGSVAADIAGMAMPVLVTLALATLVLAAIGVMAARRLRGLVSYLVVASAGTLLLAIGLGTVQTLGAGLFYMVNSTLVAATWFLLADRISAARGDVDMLRPRVMAGAWAPLGVAFVVASVAVAGMPPLAGFFGKALLLQAAALTPWAVWVVALVLASSLATMVALARAGSSLFWKPATETAAQPPLSTSGGMSASTSLNTSATRPVHGIAIIGLLITVVALALLAGPVNGYTEAAAQQMVQRQPYIDAVLGARPVPAAYDVRKEMHERGEFK